MSRVLVIDSDRKVCQRLREYFLREEMIVHFMHDDKSGLSAAFSGRYDLVVLDVTLPGLVGTQVIRQLRAHSGIGVVCLSAAGEETEKITAFECGADDYLAKPFNPRELVARIRALSRRLTRSTASDLLPAPRYLEIGDLILDAAMRTCRRNGEVIQLTSGEFDLLLALLRCRGRVIHRADLSKRVLDREYSPYDRCIDVRVSTLRRKLGPLPDGTERIRGIRAVGYLYAHPAAPHPSSSQIALSCTKTQLCSPFILPNL
jgi:two-component system response regulator CpxR